MECIENTTACTFKVPSTFCWCQKNNTLFVYAIQTIWAWGILLGFTATFTLSRHIIWKEWTSYAHQKNCSMDFYGISHRIHHIFEPTWQPPWMLALHHQTPLTVITPQQSPATTTSNAFCRWNITFCPKSTFLLVQYAVHCREWHSKPNKPSKS